MIEDIVMVCYLLTGPDGMATKRSASTASHAAKDARIEGLMWS